MRSPPLAQAAYPLIVYCPYPLRGWSSPTWSGSSSTSANPGTPQLPPAPTLPPIPLPTVYDYELDGRNTRTPPPSTAARRGLRASAALRFPPRVDPLIAYTLRTPLAHTPGAWDLLYDPRTMCALSRGHPTARCAVLAAPEDGGKPLRSLVLIFRSLPLQITITPSYVFSHDNRRVPDTFVSIWDVLAGLYSALRAPVDIETFVGPEKERVCRAADLRMQLLKKDRRPERCHVVRNIDLLEKRCFLGIRVATPSEVPQYRTFGEVFVVEVGSG